jgi:ribosomal protein L12E/L44/L45/RPP1/RPP2
VGSPPMLNLISDAHEMRALLRHLDTVGGLHGAVAASASAAASTPYAQAAARQPGDEVSAGSGMKAHKEEQEDEEGKDEEQEQAGTNGAPGRR